MESGINNNCQSRSEYSVISWGISELDQLLKKIDRKSKEYKMFFINDINGGQKKGSESVKTIELKFITDLFKVFSGFIVIITFIFIFEIFIMYFLKSILIN